MDQDRKSKLDEVHCLIIRYEERKVLSKIPKIVMVHVHHYPHEGSDLDDMAVLWEGGWGWGYGEVKDCTRQYWPNLPTVHTVTRLVKMEVKQPIPSDLNIGWIVVKIWYTEQPAKCDTRHG